MAICEPGSTFNPSVRDNKDPARGSATVGHETLDLTRSKAYGAIPVISVVQGQNNSLKLYLFDRNGAPIAIPESGMSVRLLVKETVKSSTTLLDLDANVSSADDGEVEISLDGTDTLTMRGIYTAQLQLLNSEDELEATTDYWFVVTPSLSVTTPARRPISIAEVRLFLRDQSASVNLLLQDFEFDDSTILACMTLPIDEFNEKYRPTTSYTPANFPWRYNWLRAACGYLLEIAATGYARDHLPYNSGGVAIDDKNKTQLYMGLASRLLEEWRDFIANKKLDMNLNSCYGSLGSEYSRGT